MPFIWCPSGYANKSVGASYDLERLTRFKVPNSGAFHRQSSDGLNIVLAHQSAHETQSTATDAIVPKIGRSRKPTCSRNADELVWRKPAPVYGPFVDDFRAHERCHVTGASGFNLRSPHRIRAGSTGSLRWLWHDMR